MDVTVALDGVVIIDRSFNVGNQHNHIEHRIQLDEGTHTLDASTVIDGKNILLSEEFSIEPGQQRYAGLNHWHYDWRRSVGERGTDPGARMTSRLRVVVADDHQLFRQGLAALLATVAGIEVVAEAGDGEAAVRAVARERPDVVLVDLQMPGGGGINAIRAITDRFPDVATLVLTMFQDDDSLYGAISAGARGYVLKDADDEELIRAIVTVGNGGVTYGAAVAPRIAAALASTRRRVEPSEAFPTLTASELRVLEQLAEGHSNAVIAADLGYSPKTIRNYVSIILAKLCVEDRAQAIVAAREAGAHRRR